jgi:hypothetical protein
MVGPGSTALGVEPMFIRLTTADEVMIERLDPGK